MRTAPSGRETMRSRPRPTTWLTWMLPPPRSSTWPSPSVVLLTAPRKPYQASSSADSTRTSRRPPAVRASITSSRLAASRAALVVTAATSSMPARLDEGGVEAGGVGGALQRVGVQALGPGAGGEAHGVADLVDELERSAGAVAEDDQAEGVGAHVDHGEPPLCGPLLRR